MRSPRGWASPHGRSPLSLERDHMALASSVYLAIEVLFISFYARCLFVWLGWKPGGPYQFPGSPDAGALYSDALDTYRWASGFLAGLWIGGIACLFLSRFLSPRGASTALTNALAVALLFLPPAALIAGHIFRGPHARQLARANVTLAGKYQRTAATRALTVGWSERGSISSDNSRRGSMIWINHLRCTVAHPRVVQSHR